MVKEVFDAMGYAYNGNAVSAGGENNHQAWPGFDMDAHNSKGQTVPCGENGADETTCGGTASNMKRLCVCGDAHGNAASSC